MKLAVLIVLVLVAASARATAAAVTASMLPEKPAGFGRPITDRDAWNGLAAKPPFKPIVPQAVQFLGQPLPEMSDELYLHFSRTDTHATSGKYSLRICDETRTLGSNVRSARVAATGRGAYELRGKALRVSGDGLGLYVHFLDRDGKLINKRDSRGNIAPVGTLGGPAGKWHPFAFRFETPPETVALQLWIHSFNAATVDIYLDDLALVSLPPVPGRP